jgi:hypothetical protein
MTQIYYGPKISHDASKVFKSSQVKANISLVVSISYGTEDEQ